MGSQDPGHVTPQVSASVGHDHWANDVLKAVDSSKNLSEVSGPLRSLGGSGSNSPESYCDSASDGQNLGHGGLEGPGGSSPLSKEALVKAKILEKKRKFHTGRCLELKNLPDGCVEQVSFSEIFQNF